MHNLSAMVFTNEAQDAANGVHEFDAPIGFTIWGASLCAESFANTPTGFNADIQDDGTDVITAITANTAGTPGTWYTPALGGTNTPVHIAAGSDVEVDINFAGGSSPTADYTLVLYVTWDEV